MKCLYKARKVSGDVCVCWCIYFAYFYDFDILNWNCSECVVCFVPSVWYALFRVCGIFFLQFINNTKDVPSYFVKQLMYCTACTFVHANSQACMHTSTYTHKHITHSLIWQEQNGILTLGVLVFDNSSILNIDSA